MQKLKKEWLRFSLKQKIVVVVALIMIIITLSEGLTVMVTQSSLKEFEKIMNNNSTYHELQKVIKEEQETFIAYMRNRTDENKTALEKACKESEICIAALPFLYSEIGEERYARTWNIVNGYEGYQIYRDEMLEKKEEDAGYIEALYEVLEMQDNLSAYALRLVQVTLNQWDIVYKEEMEFLQIIPLLILGITFFMMTFTIGVWHLILETMVKPLVLVAEDSRRIALNEFDTAQLHIENEDEIGELVKAFNKMKKAMKSYISTLEEKNKMAELLHKEELEKVEMEKSLEHTQLEVLKNQVNPHFLFNTLNIISCMARMEDAKTTDKMIVSLGNMFRYNLRTVEQEVYLEQEVEVLDNYIYIQQMRFGNRIEYEKIIKVDANKVKIPSFTLQPIVENAFIHGLSLKEEGGRIILKIWEKDNRIIITITDNGQGIEQHILKEMNEKIHKTNTSGRGIGLGNICRRIDMMYEESDFRIYSTSGKGTIVKLEILQKKERGIEDV